MLPTTVPRERIAGWATCCSTSRSSGSRSATSGERSAARLAHQRAEDERPVVEHRLGRLVAQEVEVDQVRRGGQAHVEDRDQALAAGQQLRLRAELREQAVDLLAGARPVIGERSGLHGLGLVPLGSGALASGVSESPIPVPGSGSSGWKSRSTW